MLLPTFTAAMLYAATLTARNSTLGTTEPVTPSEETTHDPDSADIIIWRRGEKPPPRWPVLHVPSGSKPDVVDPGFDPSHHLQNLSQDPEDYLPEGSLPDLLFYQENDTDEVNETSVAPTSPTQRARRDASEPGEASTVVPVPDTTTDVNEKLVVETLDWIPLPRRPEDIDPGFSPHHWTRFFNPSLVKKDSAEVPEVSKKDTEETTPVTDEAKRSRRDATEPAEASTVTPVPNPTPAASEELSFETLTWLPLPRRPEPIDPGFAPDFWKTFFNGPLVNKDPAEVPKLNAADKQQTEDATCETDEAGRSRRDASEPDEASTMTPAPDQTTGATEKLAVEAVNWLPLPRRPEQIDPGFSPHHWTRFFNRPLARNTSAEVPELSAASKAQAEEITPQTDEPQRKRREVTTTPSQATSSSEPADGQLDPLGSLANLASRLNLGGVGITDPGLARNPYDRVIQMLRDLQRENAEASPEPRRASVTAVPAAPSQNNAQGADSTASEPLSGLKKLGSSLLDAFKTELEREIFRSGLRDMNPHPATRDFLATLFGNRSSSE